MTTATEDMEWVDEFKQEVIRKQLIKLLQLRAARALLSHRDCLKLALISPLLKNSCDVSQNLPVDPQPVHLAALVIPFNDNNTL